VKPILIDTNAYVAFKRGRPEAISVLQHAPGILFNPVVLGELLGGFAEGSCENENRSELAQFLASPRVAVLPLDYHTAEQYATIYVALKRAGTPIPGNDMWIAASAVQHGLALFSYDNHFRLVDGLRVGVSLTEFSG